MCRDFVRSGWIYEQCAYLDKQSTWCHHREHPFVLYSSVDDIFSILFTLFDDSLHTTCGKEKKIVTLSANHDTLFYLFEL